MVHGGQQTLFRPGFAQVVSAYLIERESRVPPTRNTYGSWSAGNIHSGKQQRRGDLNSEARGLEKGWAWFHLLVRMDPEGFEPLPT
jgi:hypothetical protein